MKRMMFAAFMLFASVASAQSVTYPGSMWSTNGTGSVAEPGNKVSRSHAEQGVAKGAFSVVFEGNLVGDTIGYDWNRLAGVGVLGRYTLTLPKGALKFNLGYEQEKRFVVPRTLGGVVYTVDAWFGWDLKK